MIPTLLFTDSACTIDRPMDLSSHPLEIQSLFYFALRAACKMLIKNNEGKALIDKINSRFRAVWRVGGQ